MDDLISREVAIDVLHGYFDGMLETDTVCPADIYGLFKCIPSAQTEQPSREYVGQLKWERDLAIQQLKDLGYGLGEKPRTQQEPLTDKEQRIFLAAMGREEKVCAEVDRNYVREPYEDSLVRVCKEIKRKVKGALWT